MKKIPFFLLLVISELALCQDSLSNKAPKTELERVQIKIGTVIKKEFIKVFSYSAKNNFKAGNFEVNILNLTDASTGLIISGLSISTIDRGTTYQSAESFSSFIDLDEIPALLKFIELMDKTQTEKPENYTELIFNSKDLQVYSYYQPPVGKKQPGWSYGLKVESYSSRSAVTVDLSTLIGFRESIIYWKRKFAKPLNL